MTTSHRSVLLLVIVGVTALQGALGPFSFGDYRVDDYSFETAPCLVQAAPPGEKVVQGEAVSAVDCAENCVFDPDCQSFSYGDVDKRCVLRHGPAARGCDSDKKVRDMKAWPCQNGGTYEDRQCLCRPPYSGKYCETNIGCYSRDMSLNSTLGYGPYFDVIFCNSHPVDVIGYWVDYVNLLYYWDLLTPLGCFLANIQAGHVWYFTEASNNRTIPFGDECQFVTPPSAANQTITV